MAASGSQLRSSPQCRIPNLTPSTVPIVHSTTFHNIVVGLGTTCAALAILISLSHILQHASHAYRLDEQKYIMRVILVIPIFSICFTVTAWVYATEQYLAAVPEVWEAIALVSLFQLFVAVVSGSGKWQQQQAFFAHHGWPSDASRRQSERVTLNKDGHDESGSQRWYRTICICLYQFPLVKGLEALVFDVATRILCPTSKGAMLAQIIQAVVNMVTVTIALGAMTVFYRRFRVTLKPHRAFRKVVVLKQMIGVVLLQRILLAILQATGKIVPTRQMSYGDYTVGLASLLTQIEMVLFSIGFLFCYPAKEYSPQRYSTFEDGGNQGNVHGNSHGKTAFGIAIWELVNLSDFFRGMVSCVRHGERPTA